MKSKEKSLEEAVINLYLDLKVRRSDQEYNIESEKEKLRTLDARIVLDYIKSIIDIIVELKCEEKIQSHNEKINLKERAEDTPQPIDEYEPINEYENALRHLEAEVRNHIKIEHQLKLHSETLQARVEELEKQKDELKLKLKTYQEQMSKHKSGGIDNKEVDLLRSENNNLKLLIKSYEDRNNIIIELEKKLRSQQARYEKEVKDLESAYKEKIKSYLRINLNKNLGSSKKNLVEEELSRNITQQKIENTKTSTSVLTGNQVSHRASSVTDRKKDNNINISKRVDKTNVKFIIDEIKEHKQDAITKQKTAVLDSSDLSSKMSRITNINKESADSSDMQALYVPKTHRKVESIDKAKNSKHNRNYSFDKTHNKSNISSTNNNSGHISNVQPPSNQKQLKKVYDSKEKHSNVTKSMPSSHINSKQISMVNLNQNNSAVFANQSNNSGQLNVPLINNINIFAANMNNFKSNDINVRQYIFNKINKSKSGQKHARSSSVTNQ